MIEQEYVRREKKMSVYHFPTEFHFFVKVFFFAMSVQLSPYILQLSEKIGVECRKRYLLMELCTKLRMR